MTNAVVTGTPNVQILVAKYQKEPKLHREKVGNVQDEPGIPCHARMPESCQRHLSIELRS